MSLPRWPAIGPLGAPAVVASVALPLGMTVWGGAAGALPRVMFAVAYAWYAAAAVRLSPRTGRRSDFRPCPAPEPRSYGRSARREEP